jgi:hypothetical protein
MNSKVVVPVVRMRSNFVEVKISARFIDNLIQVLVFLMDSSRQMRSYEHVFTSIRANGHFHEVSKNPVFLMRFSLYLKFLLGEKYSSVAVGGGLQQVFFLARS